MAIAFNNLVTAIGVYLIIDGATSLLFSKDRTMMMQSFRVVRIVSGMALLGIGLM